MNEQILVWTPIIAPALADKMGKPKAGNVTTIITAPTIDIRTETDETIIHIATPPRTPITTSIQSLSFFMFCSRDYSNDLFIKLLLKCNFCKVEK
jgi:hypothetical protein